mgnify:CR=1 FL=1
MRMGDGFWDFLKTWPKLEDFPDPVPPTQAQRYERIAPLRPYVVEMRSAVTSGSMDSYLVVPIIEIEATGMESPEAWQ